jgi:zinc/manganese transport system permease protein
VFATLIMPAIATSMLPEKRGLPVGYLIAGAGYALGLWLSVPFDLPAGPFIVCVLATLVIVTGIVRRLRG